MSPPVLPGRMALKNWPAQVTERIVGKLRLKRWIRRKTRQRTAKPIINSKVPAEPKQTHGNCTRVITATNSDQLIFRIMKAIRVREITHRPINLSFANLTGALILANRD